MKTQLLEAEIAGRKKGLEEGLAEGLAKGHAEGLAKGHAEGQQQEKIETARKMKADGMPAELIAKYTGLRLEEVNDIS